MTRPARSEHPRYGNMLRYDCGAGHDHPTRAHARRCPAGAMVSAKLAEGCRAMEALIDEQEASLVTETRTIQATEPAPDSDPHDSGEAS